MKDKKEKGTGYIKRPPSLIKSENPETISCGSLYLSSETITVVGLAQLMLDLLEKESVQKLLYETEKRNIKGIGGGVG